MSMKTSRKSQKRRILTLLLTHGTVTCKSLQREYLYHRAAARIWELKQNGFNIHFIPGDTPMKGKYVLMDVPQGEVAA